MQLKINPRFLLLLLLLLGMIAIPCVMAAEEKTYSILNLNSYHLGWGWSDRITNTIRSEVATQLPGSDVMVEYLNTRKIPLNDTRIIELKEYMADKYRGKKFDAIISSDDDAFQFLLKTRDELFPGVPVIFSGVNNFEDQMISGKRGITGIVEKASMIENIDLILKNHKDADTIYIINEEVTSTGKAFRKQIDSVLPNYQEKVTFEILNELSIDELKEKVAQISASDAILLVNFAKDKNGQVFSYEENADLIRQYRKAPVYGVLDSTLGNGVIGGKMNSGVAHGTAAIDMAIQILNGKDATDIPVMKESPNVYLFDNVEMRHFGIEPGMLPAESSIINRPFNFVEAYGIYIIIIVAVFIGFVIFIIYLIRSIRKARRTEAELVDTSARITGLMKRTELIMQRSPIAIVTYNPSLQTTSVNDVWLNITGYSREKLLTMKISDYEIFNCEGEPALRAIRDCEIQKGTSSLKTAGRIFHFEYYYIPITNEKGEVVELVGMYVNVTDQRNLLKQLEKSITELSGCLAALADSDLTKPVAVYDGDPLVAIKQDLNQSLDALRMALKTIIGRMGALKDSSGEVAERTTNLADLAGKVATVSEETTTGIGNQITRLEKITEEITHLSASIEEIASTSRAISDLTAGVAKAGEAAVVQGEDAGAKMKSIEIISRAAVDEIRSFNYDVQEISNILRIITDIADQTNLLALNAAIEAARAGDAGRGFAVVADEVKTLAGRSQEATGSIDALIGKITANSTSTMDAMNRAYQEVLVGIESVNRTLDSLNRMVSDVNGAVTGIADITRTTEDQAHVTNRITSEVHSINEAMVPVRLAVADLSMLAEESDHATVSIAGETQKIKGMVEDIEDLIGSFKTG
jgi:methyl-accepting chemotaxis protein